MVAPVADRNLPFARRLEAAGGPLRRTRPEILQLNLGRICNLTCMHCHVNAGPARKEMMSVETAGQVLDWWQRHLLPTLDLTGGAPEMTPAFRPVIEEVRATLPEARIIDRCNLTILLEPGYEWLLPFLVEHRVEIVASMPCYSPENVNEQRGDGVFDASIEALQRLNEAGYGDELALDLVYNPNGAFLPGSQEELEADYKKALAEHFGISFNRLYTITNMPIARFASWLRHSGELETYMELLREAFNPATVDGLMCRNTLNVDWLGGVYDCDFNQMLDLPLKAMEGRPRLWEVDPSRLDDAPIAMGEHCFGCTAGCGSSCGGSLA